MNETIRSKKKFLPFLFLFAASLVIYLTQLGNPVTGGQSDEPLYIGIARSMMAHHNWMVPTFHGQLAFYKPPFLYWMMIFAFKLFGNTLFSSRFPAAFCGALLVLVTALLGEQMFNSRKAGLMSGIIAATTIPGVYAFARAALMDIPMTFFITLSLYLTYRFIREEKAVFLILSLTSLGVSTNFKGPVSFLIGIFPILYLLHSSGKIQVLWKKEGIAAVAGCLFFSFLWPVGVALHGDGGEWLKFFIIQQNFGKFTSKLDPRTRYISDSVIWISLLSQFMPWSFFFLGSAVWFSLKKERRSSAVVFLILWIAAVLVIFLLPAKKLSHYTLPALPAQALLSAGFIELSASSALSDISFYLTGTVFAITGFFLFFLTRISQGFFEFLVILLASISFLIGSFFLFKKDLLKPLYLTCFFLFLYSFGLPRLMSSLDFHNLEKAMGHKPLYVYHFDAAILARALGRPIVLLKQPEFPSAAAGESPLLILPQPDEISFERNGIQLSPPLLTWTRWEDHIRILDLFQGILSSNPKLIQEKIVFVKVEK
ncbi:MAG: glycosyltransferase family 39 protein [Firmicutes bacterium]|nr:glycosyltransferase family 39 protein [Bacillota bacterium]